MQLRIMNYLPASTHYDRLRFRLTPRCCCCPSPAAYHRVSPRHTHFCARRHRRHYCRRRHYCPRRRRHRPYSLVIFDDVHRAHPEVVALLAQVSSTGRLTDSKGVSVDFRNTLLVFTVTTTPTPPTAQAVAAAAATSAASSTAGSPTDGAPAVDKGAGLTGSSHSGTGANSTTTTVTGPAFGGHGALELDDDEEGPTTKPAPAQSSATQAPPTQAAGDGYSAAAPLPAMPPAVRELVQGVDDVVRFLPLRQAEAESILRDRLSEAAAQLAGLGVSLEVDDGAVRRLAAAARLPGGGLQQLDVVIRQKVLIPLANAALGTGGGGFGIQMPSAGAVVGCAPPNVAAATASDGTTASPSGAAAQQPSSAVGRAVTVRVTTQSRSGDYNPQLVLSIERS